MLVKKKCSKSISPYLDCYHVSFDLADLTLAGLYALGEFLQLRSYLAECNGRLQLTITTLKLIQLGTQVHTHHADLLLQTVHTHTHTSTNKFFFNFRTPRSISGIFFFLQEQTHVHRPLYQDQLDG